MQNNDDDFDVDAFESPKTPKTPKINDDAIRDFQVPVGTDMSVDENVFDRKKSANLAREKSANLTRENSPNLFENVSAEDFDAFFRNEPFPSGLGLAPSPDSRPAKTSLPRRPRNAPKVIDQDIEHTLNFREKNFPKPDDLPPILVSISKKDLKRMTKAANPFDELPQEIIRKIEKSVVN